MAGQVAELFYDRLFELDPSLEDLFPGDLSGQGPKFMRAIGLAVSGLDAPEVQRPFLQELARRHLAYGVTSGHYVTLGKALLWTFEQSLTEAFTPPVKDAWAAVYLSLSSVMLDAVEEREGLPSPKPTQLAM